jgi:hypothetical protein
VKARPLALMRQVPSMSAAERGKLLSAAEVAQQVFGGKVSKKWVFGNVPTHYRHNVGRCVLYYEGEVRAWVDTLREAA